MQDKQREKNLDTLEKLYPGIKKTIEEQKDKLLKEEQLQIEEETAFNGETILKVQTKEHKVYLAGRRDPVGPAKNQIGLLGKIEKTAPIFMVGLGNIHYLEELRKVTDESVMILIYEPSFSIFYKMLELIDVETLFADRTIALCVQGINEEGYSSLFYSMLNGDRVAIMKQFVLPNYEIICPEQLRDFIKELNKQVIGYRMNVNTGIRFSEVKADNFFHNIDYVRTGYKARQLTDVLPLDIPAIVVSAGPSLNKNVAELKKAKNKAFIIAVDTAMKPLLNAGVTPDMFAIIDGLKPLKLIEDDRSKNIPLITTIDSAKAVLDFHTGKKFFYNEGKEYMEHLFEMNGQSFEGVNVGGSVATLALSLVCHVGFKRVILVGQDLAYTDNKSHADGTFEEHMKTIDTSHYKMVEGNDGELVPTDGQMNSYREWIQDFIEYWKKNNKLRVINATEGGAKINGTEVMTLKEAIEKECDKTVDMDACFAELKPVFNEEEQAKILQFFHDTPKEIHQIVTLAEEGKRSYTKLQKQCSSGNMDQAGYVKLLRKIKRINKKIENNVNYQMISETLTLAEQIIKTGQYREYASFEEEGLEIAKQGLKYMDLLERCAELFEKLAQETVGVAEA